MNNFQSNAKFYFAGVELISSFFGVNFSTKRDNKLILIIQCFFIAFTCFFYRYSLKNILLPVFFVLIVVQVIFPLIIEIAISCEALYKKKFEVKIWKKFKTLESILEKNLGQRQLNEVNHAFTWLIVKFMFLLILRTLKIIFGGVTFSFNMLFTELCCSASDYAFTFYVDLLTIYVKCYSEKLLRGDQMDIRKDYLTFYKLANLLTRRFSISLLLNVTFNFITLIISFYWIFIRIAYGRLTR